MWGVNDIVCRRDGLVRTALYGHSDCGSSKHLNIVVTVPDSKYLTWMDTRDPAVGVDPTPFQDSRWVDDEPVGAIGGLGVEHYLQAVVNQEASGRFESIPRETEHGERVDRSSSDSDVKVLHPAHITDVSQVRRAGPGMVRDDDVDDRVLDVDAWFKACGPECSKGCSGHGGVEQCLVEPLLGPEVDADRPVNEHSGYRKTCCAEIGAHDAWTARGGGENGDAPRGELADGVGVPLRHHHVARPKRTVEVRGDQADHGVSLHDAAGGDVDSGGDSDAGRVWG